MTDSHMVGGHKSDSAGGRLLQQAAYFVAILAGVTGLYVISAFLGSEDPRLKAIAWGVIGALVVLVVAFQIRKRRSRRSLDEVLRSRRKTQ